MGRLGSPQLSDGCKTRRVQEIDKDLAPPQGLWARMGEM